MVHFEFRQALASSRRFVARPNAGDTVKRRGCRGGGGGAVTHAKSYAGAAPYGNISHGSGYGRVMMVYNRK